MALLARAARLLGPRDRNGRLVVQTRHPKHPVLDAVLHADPGRLVATEQRQRIELGFPPATATGGGVGSRRGRSSSPRSARPLGVDVLGPADGRWLLRAPDHRTLCDALAATPRPQARTRIEVDPLRI